MWIREIVEDNKTRRVSSSQFAFITALVISSFILLKVTFALLAVLHTCGEGAIAIAVVSSLLSFLRDFFTIYIAAFAAAHLGSKAIMAFSPKPSSTATTTVSTSVSSTDDDQNQEGDEEFPVEKPAPKPAPKGKK